MMTVSIAKVVSSKTIAPALVVGAASAAALLYAWTKAPHGAKLESSPVAVMAPATGASTSRDSGDSKVEVRPPDALSGTATAAAPLAATQSEVADLSARLGEPAPASAPPSLPAFDVARVEASGEAVIAGRAAPGATVELRRKDERLDRVVADASGQFVMVSPHLPAGSYELSLSATAPDGTVAASRQGVAVTVKEAEASTGSIAVRPTAPAPSAIQQPEAERPAGPSVATAAPDDGMASRKTAAAANGTRIVSRGDSLWRISRITYGAGEQYAIVYRANRDRIRDPNLIHPGQVLVLPVKRR